MDVDTIEPGLDFYEVLEKAVGNCDFLVAVIGPDWLKMQDQNGGRRLDDPSDLVRIEIAAALSRGVRVIPVLMDGASMPRASELPSELLPLTRRQAISISHERFGTDCEVLVQTIKKSALEGHRLHGYWAIPAGVLALLLGAGFYFQTEISSYWFRHNTPPSPSIGDQKRADKGADRSIETPVSKTLAPIALHHETMVLYATVAGGVALDGKDNSPFSSAIVSALKEGITDIEIIAKKVIANVRVVTGDQQSPVYETNLTRSINLADKQFDKIALIIGNTAYAHVPSLANPARDAEILARQLGHLDFETVVSLDAGQEQLRRTIRRFVNRLKSASKNTIAILYYGGHALQFNGTNFIIPTDAKIEQEAALASDAVSVQEIIDAMREANISASIVLLDACRDNPFVNALASSSSTR